MRKTPSQKSQKTKEVIKRANLIDKIQFLSANCLEDHWPINIISAIEILLIKLVSDFLKYSLISSLLIAVFYLKLLSLINTLRHF